MRRGTRRLTVKGKKHGNQLSMSPADLSGWIDSPTSRYSTASKYPAKPWHTPALGMWNVRCVERALWWFVIGNPAWSTTTSGLGCWNVQHSWILSACCRPPWALRMW